jgi:prepilin-type N-terminal cleavage/methylation domain-containing protein
MTPAKRRTIKVRSDLTTVSPDRNRHRGEQGFTLIEMAVVLVIMGLLIAMLAPLLGNISENNRVEVTLTRLDKINDALVVYLRQNGRLPCPAAPDGDPLGIERAHCSGGVGTGGVVPFRTLGLPQADARDGYANYFTYHVAGGYADEGLATGLTDPLGFCFVSGGVPDGDLDIEDASGNSVTSQDIAYVVLSHGKNGHGRFNPPGNGKIGADLGGPFEVENSDDDYRFIDSVRIEDEGASGPYDDVISWKTRDGLAGQAIEFGCSR